MQQACRHCLESLKMPCKTAEAVVLIFVSRDKVRIFPRLFSASHKLWSTSAPVLLTLKTFSFFAVIIGNSHNICNLVFVKIRNVNVHIFKVVRLTNPPQGLNGFPIFFGIGIIKQCVYIVAFKSFCCNLWRTFGQLSCKPPCALNVFNAIERTRNNHRQNKQYKYVKEKPFENRLLIFILPIGFSDFSLTVTAFFPHTFSSCILTRMYDKCKT